MLIDPSYFHGEILIAQRGQLEVQEDIEGLIAKYEPKILRELLGKSLYKEFMEGLEDPFPDPKWINLRDGVDGEWMGLANMDKLSLIANYVYYHWMRKENLQTVGIGTVKVEAENAVKASPVEKYVRAWNEMVDWICELHDYIRDHIDDYPDYAWKDYHSPCTKCHCGCCNRKKFPFTKINSLGL